MTVRSARELARRYDEMLGAIGDGRDTGDRFEAWLERYRREATRRGILRRLERLGYKRLGYKVSIEPFAA
jgi:hypothetical protein